MSHVKQVIGVIGAGSMGQALIAGWVAQDSPDREILALVRDLPKYQFLSEKFGPSVRVTDDRSELLQCTTIVIAIKPQIIRELLHEFTPFIAPDCLLISVAAGITCGFIENCFPQTQQVIRAMPNTPSIIGRGVTGVSAGAGCSRASVDRAVQLMSAVGTVVELPESQQNDLAAVSGSGPAYLFYLAENLIRGAQELGLDSELAQSLVRETLMGAAELLAGSPASPEQLRQQVTSPGGMTAAAMEVLDVCEVGPAVIDALARGTERARELGG